MKNYPAMFEGSNEQPFWISPLTFNALLNQRHLRKTVNELFVRRIDWRRAQADDWPAIPLKGDFRKARKSGVGFVCHVDEVQLFVVPCHSDWSWQALARYDPRDGKWLRLGRFSPDPLGWAFPLPEDWKPIES
jgi:hypothetical protein